MLSEHVVVMTSWSVDRPVSVAVLSLLLTVCHRRSAHHVSKYDVNKHLVCLGHDVVKVIVEGTTPVFTSRHHRLVL